MEPIALFITALVAAMSAFVAAFIAIRNEHGGDLDRCPIGRHRQFTGGK
jgi:hypothetical protein